MTKNEMSKKKLIPSGDVIKDSISNAIPQEEQQQAGASEQQQPSGLTQGALLAVGSKYQLTVAQMKEVAMFMAVKMAVLNRRNGIQQATGFTNPFNMPPTCNNDDATPSAKEGNQMSRVMPIRHDSDRGDDAAHGVNPEQDEDAEFREMLSRMLLLMPPIEEVASGIMEKPKNEDSPPTENGLQQIYQDQNAKLRNTVLATCGRFATDFRDSFKADRSSSTLRVAPQNQASSSSSADVAEDVVLEAYKNAEARNELSKILGPKQQPHKSSLNRKDKVEARRAEAEQRSEMICARLTLEPSFSKYYGVQTWLRNLLATNAHLMYGVYTNDFERSLIQYYVEHANGSWNFFESFAKVTLTQLESKHQADTPEDKQLRQKICFLLESFNLLIVQDITAITALYKVDFESKIANQYMDLVFNPERTPLTFNSMSPHVRLENLRILENPVWSQGFVEQMLNSYVKRQSEIRVGDNLDGVVFAHTLDEHFNQIYFACKEDYNEVWTNNRSDLIDSYVKYWTWQRDELKKEALKTDQQGEKLVLHIHLTEAMLHHSHKDPYFYVLLFDAHQLKRLQDELYESPNLDQLIETKEFYFHMIFGADRWL